MRLIRLRWNPSSSPYINGYELSIRETGLVAPLGSNDSMFECEVPTGTPLYAELVAIGSGGRSDPAVLEFMVDDGTQPPPKPEGFAWEVV